MAPIAGKGLASTSPTPVIAGGGFNLYDKGILGCVGAVGDLWQPQ